MEMKKILLIGFVLFVSKFTLAQLPERYIILGNDTSLNFGSEYKRGLLLHNLRNYKVNYAANTSIELLHIAFPAVSGSKGPEVGTYAVLGGGKKKVKKGSFTVRIISLLDYESVEGTGEVIVSFTNELYTIEVKSVKMKHEKTGEEKILNARTVLFIGE
jgi:hypothetical protein